MTTALDTIAGNGRTAARIGQATAVEQSRAVAEVQAAIVVAQQCPRNVALAIDMMRESCRRKELAERAFFSYKRGGTVTGPSVHLARELARCWGNIQYGLREMRRDDEASEMLAYAWDVQTNARCDNIVINPHRGYTGGRELTDLRDVYENNANVGARRVREAIFAVLPAWYVEEAVEICNQTLKQGDGKPLPLRIASAIEVFGNLGVKVTQLEAKHGPSAKWDERTVAQLLITHRSITRGEISKDEAFPDAGLTAADILQTPAAQAPVTPDAEPQPVPPATTQAGKPAPEKLADLERQVLGTWPDDEIRETYERITGAEWTATKLQVTRVTQLLSDALKAAKGDPEAASASLWKQFHGDGNA